jgi:hypothetical protein
VQEVWKMAVEMGSPDAADFARSMLPINLIRNTLPHATEAQRETLRAMLAALS